jgi:hypothetical protein
MNDDGTLDVDDVSLLISMLVGGGDLPPYADVNGDGEIDVSDVTKLIINLLK